MTKLRGRIFCIHTIDQFGVDVTVTSQVLREHRGGRKAVETREKQFKHSE